MGRNISVIAILLLVITGAILETVFVEKVLKKMEEYTTAISTNVQNDEALDELDELVLDCQKYWENKERILCLVISHRDLLPITTTLSHLTASVKYDNKDDAKLYSYILKEDIKQLSHIIAFRPENIL